MGCNYREKGDGTSSKSNSDVSSFAAPGTEENTKQEGVLTPQGEISAIPDRKIREDTCQHFGYRLTDKGNQVAYFYDTHRRIIAGKVRMKALDENGKKRFKWIGEPKKAGLYGQWLWPTKGKLIVVTEGEIDCLSVSQLQGNKWPVVSITNGAQGAAKQIKENLEFLSGYDAVVLMFDMDEPGQLAANECAELLPPGKAKIASLPLKDANECLMQGKGDEVIRAMWNARTYRPDGILNGEDLWEAIIEDKSGSRILYPWECLNEKTHGAGECELITLTAGSGIGKSAIVREIAMHFVNQGETVGMIMLEEAVRHTALAMMGLHLNKRLHISREGVTDEQMKQAFDATVGSGRVYLYDHFGSTEIERLVSRVRHLAKSLDCKRIFLDHLSIVVSAMSEDGDERKLLDKAMTLLRTLVQETGITLFLVSHLKRPEGRGHEEGAHTSLSQLRGSHAIAQLSDFVIGLERNQQGDNPNETFLRILKNRFSGETGPAGSLHYNTDTGRLTEVEAAKENGEF
jgi:twinkle protein